MLVQKSPVLPKMSDWSLRKLPDVPLQLSFARSRAASSTLSVEEAKPEAKPGRHLVFATSRTLAVIIDEPHVKRPSANR